MDVINIKHVLPAILLKTLIGDAGLVEDMVAFTTGASPAQAVCSRLEVPQLPYLIVTTQ